MSLLNCIENIPISLETILNNFEQIQLKINIYLKKYEINELIFIASGTSLNAAKVTRYFAQNNCKIECRFFCPNEFNNYIEYVNPKALYILVSQGGSTKLVYEALLKIKKNNLCHCSLTQSDNTLIAKNSDLSIELGCGIEKYLFRTLGYSTTVLNCLLIEMIISFNSQKINYVTISNYLDELKNGIKNLTNIHSQFNGWYKDNQYELLKRQQVILAGAKDLYEVAQEADIKLMEMVPIFSRSFELEELIHGPQNVFNDNIIYFILNNYKYDSVKALKIAEFLKNEIGYCIIVGDNVFDNQDFLINFKTINFVYLEIITFFQLLAYYMAIDRGRDLSKSLNSSIKKYITKNFDEGVAK